MTIELHGPSPDEPDRDTGQKGRPDTSPTSTSASLQHRGINIQINVQRTPNYVFGQADLLEGKEFRGRLAIGSPKATPEQVHERLATLAVARAEIMKCAARSGPSAKHSRGASPRLQ